MDLFIFYIIGVIISFLVGIIVLNITNDELSLGDVILSFFLAILGSWVTIISSLIYYLTEKYDDVIIKRKK